MKFVNFNTIKIKNFLSIGNDEVEIDFKQGLNIITGINKDKQDRRNGVGKSTIADAIHFAEITGLSFDREVQKAKEYYDEADQMETVSDCACEGEEGCDCDNVDEALKFQGKFKEGDKIKAYDFEPMPGRPGSGKRIGKTMFVPYEMGMDYDDRISSA